MTAQDWQFIVGTIAGLIAGVSVGAYAMLIFVTRKGWTPWKGDK